MSDYTPDWYGRLDVDASASFSPPQEATQTWCVVLDSLFKLAEIGPAAVESLLETRAIVARQFSTAKVFDFLPIAIVEGTLDDVNTLGTLPHFYTAIPMTLALREYSALFTGLDALMSQTAHQRYAWQNVIADGNELPHPDYIGGLYPAKTYPTLFSSSPTEQRIVPPAWMAVLNISLGPKMQQNAFNPILLTLGQLRISHLIVVAAGNDGADNTMNSWAPASVPGILRVGATDDAAGEVLADYSSRGVAGKANSGPDLVSYGGAPGGGAPGTSFAAPRIARLGCIAFALQWQVRHIRNEMTGRAGLGIPLIGWGLLDTAGRGLGAIPARTDVPALPIVGPNVAAWQQAFIQLGRLGMTVDLSFNSAMLGAMLVDAAQPMPGYAEHEVGAGFLNRELFMRHFSRLSVGDYLAYLLPASSLQQLSDELKSLAAFDPKGLEYIATAVDVTRPTWFFDYYKKQFTVNDPHGERTVSAEDCGHAIDVMRSGAPRVRT